MSPLQIICACGLLAFFAIFFFLDGSRARFHVEVGPSLTPEGEAREHIAAVRVCEGKRVVDYRRIDMRKLDWEEQLAEAVVEMKHKQRALEAAHKRVNERSGW